MANHQQSKDPQKYITPFAFSVASVLYGTALASPLKRAVALLIDLFIVVLLAELSSTLLALLIAVVFWQISRQFAMSNERPMLKVVLRVLASLIVFSLLALYYAQSELQNLDHEFSSENTVIEDSSASEAVVFALTGARQNQMVREHQKNLATSDCSSTESCWQPLFNTFAEQYEDIEAPKELAEALLAAAFDAAELSTEDRQKITLALPESYKRLARESVDTVRDKEEQEGKAGKGKKAELNTQSDKLVPRAQLIQTTIEDNSPDIQEDMGSAEDYKQAPEAKEESAKYSLIRYIQAMLADLGLGFGWAAFYFTVMSAWFSGQTVGKYLLGIKVIKLNGQQMSLWESFGRYGGYGAGLATGLMGFIQIYWDPNRQAIQDKISETLVIDLRKAKYPWPAE